ncbi:hypothetical protein [Pseudoroseomonas sp. WGS1072]|uniref:hypothetical protein n=1 Tax=Roseomonas sp. WGS1072 TaxID=3366816 RepID=UPI003BF27D6C
MQQLRWIVDRLQISWSLMASEGERDQVSQFMAEGDARAAIIEGGRIDNVIVVAQRGPDGRAEFVPYFAASWRRGYVAIGLWTGTGCRSWRDLTRLVGFVRDDLQYQGPVTVHEADDTRLRKYRTLFEALPEAA